MTGIFTSLKEHLLRACGRNQPPSVLMKREAPIVISDECVGRFECQKTINAKMEGHLQCAEKHLATVEKRLIQRRKEGR